MCLYPRIIKNRKYQKSKKNGGVIPAISDKRTAYVPVGCQKCMECKKQKARGWSVRLQEDIRINKNAKFVTLTFSEESLNKIDKTIRKLSGYELDNEIAKKAMRWFLERWRKEFGKSVRHWGATELGGTKTERIHIHCLLWTDESIEVIQKHWQYGKAILGDGRGTHYVNDETIGYIVKYLSKMDKVHPEYNSKMFVSPGIGNGYMKRKDAELNKYKEGGTREEYTTRKGVKMAMPVYWRNKLYSEEEKEKLWIEKLDKEERWINGVRVDISNGEEEYYKLLEEARSKNKRYGYGDNTVNWERRKYENERRNLKKLERLRNRNTN